MGLSRSEQRQLDNELIFRHLNEQVQAGIEQVRQEESAEHPELEDESYNPTLHFYCECSDEHCTERIVLKLSEYQRLHKDRSQFIIRPGHERLEIEEVILRADDYSVVKKLAL